jgi:hypothetical protein
MMNLYLSPEQLDKLAERQVDIVNQYEALGAWKPSFCLKNEFLAQLGTDLGPFLKTSP